MTSTPSKPCLKCQKQFDNKGNPYNRICPSCHISNKSVGPKEAINIEKCFMDEVPPYFVKGGERLQENMKGKWNK